MVVRDAQASDFEFIAGLTNHFIAHTAIHFGHEAVSADELRSSWEKTRGRYPYLVSEVDGRFAGYAKAGVWRERAAYQWTAETGIYVEASLHRRGVGRTLYAALIDACRGRGFHSLIGGITLPNDASVRLHESLGFVGVGRVVRAGWKFGMWHDVGFWQLMLRDGGHVAADLGHFGA